MNGLGLDSVLAHTGLGQVLVSVGTVLTKTLFKELNV